jgi:hypothetical protein
MITCLYKGINILIYAPEAEFDFILPLLNRFANVYGIIIGSDTNPFMLVDGFDHIRLTAMYESDFMDADTYLISYPTNIELPMQIIPKLIYDMNPYLPEYTSESYHRYFNDYKNRLHSYNKPVTRVFVRGE